MAVMDEFRDKREALKDQPLKEKLKYFRDYYLTTTLVVLAIIVGAVWLIKDMVSGKETAFNAVFVNALQLQEALDPFTDPFIESIGIDQEKYEVRIDASYTLSEGYDENSYYSMQIIMTRLAAQEIDVMAMDAANFTKYVYNETYADLRTFLPETLLSKLEAEGKVFYMDQAFLTTLAELQEKTYEDPNAVIEYPQYTDPEAMEDPVPIGIRLTDSPKFQEYFTYGSSEAYIGIAINSLHQENAVTFISYLFEE